MEFLREWSPLLAILANALLGWVVWSVRRGLVSKDEHHALEIKVDGNKAEIKRVGSEVHNLISHKEWAKTNAQLARVEALIEGLHVEQKAQNGSIKMIGNYLLNKGKHG